MPENAEKTAPDAGQEDKNVTEDEPKTFSQEEVDKIVEKRLARERGKYSDYDDLKQQASKTEKLESDYQSALKRAETAESKVSAFETAKQVDEWKAQVSKDTGVPAKALRGSTLEDIQAHAETLKPLMKQPSYGPQVPGIGDQPSKDRRPRPGEDFAAALEKLGF